MASVSAPVQPPIPVSRSGVMLEAVTVKDGSSNFSPPANAISACRHVAIRAFGVWQFWQVITVLTR